MKSYTDVEQGKILFDMLPHESADFSWRASFNGETNRWEYNFVPVPHYFQSYIGVPCWSLTALIMSIPNGKIVNCGDSWTCGSGNDLQTYFETNADNPIDACVKMIIQLKQDNLL